MKSGNWVPIDKGLVSALPIDGRPYTELEAMFSLSVDYDQDKAVTVTGMAKAWGWSRNKVTRFLDRIGVVVDYPEKTKRLQNQKGQIAIQIRDRSGTDKGQIVFKDSKHLDGEKDRSGTDKGQIKDRSRNTTNDPNPNPNPNPKAKPFLSKATPLDLEFANLLAEKIKAHSPNAKCNPEKWADDFRKMRTIDKRTEPEIRQVINFATTDTFWHTVILSAGNLRKQFDPLLLKSKSNGGTKNENGLFAGIGRTGKEKETGTGKYDSIAVETFG